jgi:hypothetical protein
MSALSSWYRLYLRVYQLYRMSGGIVFESRPGMRAMPLRFYQSRRCLGMYETVSSRIIFLEFTRTGRYSHMYDLSRWYRRPSWVYHLRIM